MALLGPVSEPEIVLRQRLELEGDGVPTRFVFHAAAQMARADAERMVKHARAAVPRAARAAVDALLAALDRPVAGCALTVGKTVVPEDLEVILRSHALLHAAEGELYRGAIARACQARGLPVLEVPSKSLRTRAAEILGDVIDENLAALGLRAGRPWNMEQKESSLLAWLVLAGRS